MPSDVVITVDSVEEGKVVVLSVEDICEDPVLSLVAILLKLMTWDEEMSEDVSLAVIDTLSEVLHSFPEQLSVGLTSKDEFEFKVDEKVVSNELPAVEALREVEHSPLLVVLLAVSWQGMHVSEALESTEVIEKLVVLEIEVLSNVNDGEVERELV